VIIIKRNPYSSYLLVFLFCGVIVPTLLAGCVSHGTRKATTYRQGDISGLQKIAVTPFQAIIPGDPAAKVSRCPISGATFRTCEFPGNPEKKIEEIFVNRLNLSGRYTVIPPQEVEGVYKRVFTDFPKDSPLKILTTVGEKTGADGVIAGHLFYYRDRKGFDYSVEEPASVVFCVHLIRVKDGVPVWKGIFDKTQSSLMENIFDLFPFIRGGGKWMTADELSQEGIEEIVKDFPGLKGN